MTSPVAGPPAWDGRWHGRHGIARFAHEVRRRLRSPLEDMSPFPVRPSSALDPAFLWVDGVRRHRRPRVSPGFNATLLGAGRQLLTLHDLIHLQDPHETSPAKRAYYEHLVRPAVLQAQTVMTVSEHTREELVRWTGLDPSAVVVVGNGCSVPLAEPEQLVSPGRALVLFVGNVRPHKRFRLVVRTARLLPDDYRIATVGVPEAVLAQLCAQEGVPRETFERHDALSDADLVALYDSAGCLVVPSSSEGFGLIALEAMARGVRSVYSAAAVGEVVASTGVRVSSADPHEWASAVVTTVERGRADAGALVRRAAEFRWDDVGARVDATIEGWV